MPILTNKRLTVAKFLEDWLEAIKTSIRSKTLLNYSDMCRLHISPAIGKVRLTELSKNHVQTMLNGLQRHGTVKKVSSRKKKRGKKDKPATEPKPISPKMVRHVRACLRSALNYAVEQDLLARNVATKGIKLPRLEKADMRPMSDEQIRMFLDHVKGNRLEALYNVALTLGMRRGEILGLEWTDIDFTRRTLQVRQALQRVGKDLKASAPKTERSRRTLPLTESLAALLRQHKARQREEAFEAGKSWHKTDYVFVSSTGTALEPRNLYRQFQDLLKSSGITSKKTGRPHFAFHDLRHSFASRALRHGVSLKAISTTLGHSTIGQTADTYAHLGEDSLRDAIERVDTAMNG